MKYYHPYALIIQEFIFQFKALSSIGEGKNNSETFIKSLDGRCFKLLNNFYSNKYIYLNTLMPLFLRLFSFKFKVDPFNVPL